MYQCPKRDAGENGRHDRLKDKAKKGMFYGSTFLQFLASNLRPFSKKKHGEGLEHENEPAVEKREDLSPPFPRVSLAQTFILLPTVRIPRISPSSHMKSSIFHTPMLSLIRRDQRF
jgi:hypothetical protein